MILCHFSDLHLMHQRPYFGKHVEALYAGVTKAHEAKAELIVFVGDLSGFDAPHRMHTSERLALAALIQYAAEKSRVIVVCGNHDNPNELNIFDKLIAHHPIWVYNLPDNFALARAGNLSRPSYEIDILPWVARHTVIEELGQIPIELENIQASNSLIQRAQYRKEQTIQEWHKNKKYPRILLAHFPVAGGLVGDFEIKTSTDIMLHPEQFEGWDYVALGHYHERQQVAENAWYCGSPVPLSHAETTPKGFNLVEIGGEKVIVDFQEITSWKMQTIHLDWKDNTLLNYEETINQDFSNTYVKVKIRSFGVLGGWPTKEITDDLRKRGALSSDIERDSVIYQSKGKIEVLSRSKESLVEKTKRIMKEKMTLADESITRISAKIENLRTKLAS